MVLKQARVGAILWIACFQFFVAEQVARSAWVLPYSFRTNYISDLGALICSALVCSPWHRVMNGSFALQGLLMVTGTLFTWKLWNGLARMGVTLVLVSGLALVGVGLVPEDSVPNLHRATAAIHFIAAGMGMILVGLGSRRWFGPLSLFAGAIVIAATVTLGQTQNILIERWGVGSVERTAAYGIAGWLVVLGTWSYLPISSDNTVV